MYQSFVTCTFSTRRLKFKNLKKPTFELELNFKIWVFEKFEFQSMSWLEFQIYLQIRTSKISIWLEIQL
jgi:hypothetical protein